jgi:hypothetical protein
VSASGPPAPLAPRSFVVIVTNARPLWFGSGVNTRPSSAALIDASVPVKVMLASAVPSPVANVSPAVPASVTTPFEPARLTCTGAPPASTSVIEIWLPRPEL